MYRSRDRWQAIRQSLTGSVPQPAAAREETPDHLTEASRSIDGSFRAMRESMANARLDAVIVLVADRARTFDDANCPQIHVHAGEAIWGDTSVDEAGEAARVTQLACDARAGDFLIEELFDAGFDVAESHGEFKPAGDQKRGAVAALFEPIERLNCTVPVIPIHLNCHVSPCLRGSRTREFGAALGAAMAHSSKRFGVLASGGMSGDPHGYMAGWIDPGLDQWVLRQLESGRSSKLVPMFDVQSNALRGSSAELRLWLAAGAAMEQFGGAGRTLSYLPLHAAAAGVGFFTWEIS